MQGRSAGTGLNPMQEKFCQEYLVDLHHTGACKRAGYKNKNAHITANVLLKNPKITKRIKQLMDERSERMQITADNVLRELAVIGFSRITNYAKVVDRGSIEIKKPRKKKATKKKAVTDDREMIDDDNDDFLSLDGDDEKSTSTYVFKSVEILTTDQMKSEYIPAIQSIKQGANGIELKLHDKVRALELMGIHLGVGTGKDPAKVEPIKPFDESQVNRILQAIKAKPAVNEKIIVVNKSEPTSKQN